MMNMPDSRGAQPEPGERLFTFGLEYTDPYVSVEEIDIYANGHTLARARALEVAERDYDPNWTRLFDLPPGGSAGLVWS